MWKKIILVFIVIFVISQVFAITTFEYDETDLISLSPEATDADAQQLIYSYTEPLNQQGEWQTSYGDAGQYEVIITVSDGELSTSQDVLIIVNKKEEKPNIDSFSPEENIINIEEGENINFKISGSDLNQDSLNYEWFIDGIVVSKEKEINYQTDYEDSGEHEVKVIISDELSEVSQEWAVNVENVDLENILSTIEDLTIKETEVASLKLPNFKKYGLTYSISEPLDDKNKWQTTFDDEGEYKVIVKAEGNGFSGSKEVKIIVTKKDRSPVFKALKNIRIDENEEALIELDAIDPDNDKLIFSAQNMPDGATLEGNVFRWTPGLDFVMKESVIDNVLNKFHLLSRSVDIIIIAESGETKIEKVLKITVRDKNRPFVFEDLKTVNVNEGEMVILEPIINDPDGDKVKIMYSGWMNKNTRSTGFDDAGTYIVKITGTDGFFIGSKFITINVGNVNRKPTLESIRNFKMMENETIEIELSAMDPDGDTISYSGENLSEDAKIDENILVYNPTFETVTNKEKEFVNFKIIADDGKNKDEQLFTITVINKNRAPKINDFSKNVEVKVDDPVTLFITAEDPDGDNLSYLWDFGFFDKHNATSVHKRTFTSKGKKEIEVTVSDGFEEVIQEIIIDVV